MPTPKRGYYSSKGERVPGTTTILSRFKDSGALMYWSNNIAYTSYREARAMIDKIVKQGAVDPGTLHDCKELLKKPEDHCDYRVARESAASIGTIVHARVDAHIRNKPFDPAPYITPEFPNPIESSQLGFNAFLEWAGSTSFELIEGEMQLVSDQYRYGGTPDTVLVRGEKSVGDWKSGDLYVDSVLPQLAAYRQLLLENNHQVSAGAHAMSINKKTGGFVHRYFTPDEVAMGWKVFSMMRELYDLVNELK